jgi:hypothetical protein
VENSVPHSDSAAPQHAELRASEPFQAQLRRLHSLTHGFVVTLRLAWLTATRDPTFANPLLWRFTDDLLASAIGIELLIVEGIDNTARRELRFMFELAIRHLYVDTWEMTPGTPLETRLAFVEHRLGNRDVELVSDLPLVLVDDKDAFRGAVRRLYGELSRYTHPSPEQLEGRLERAARGAYAGFETAADLENFNDLLARTYDVLVVLLCEGLGGLAAGDLILAFDDVNDWPFHRTRFVEQVSRGFDYKAERQPLRRRPRGLLSDGSATIRWQWTMRYLPLRGTHAAGIGR